MGEWRLVPYDPVVVYKGIKRFDCGNEMINRFVTRALKKRVKKHLSRAYVLLDGSGEFAGFYTLDTFAITRELFDTVDGPAGLPPSVPVVKLGMLGVDRRWQKQGLGKRLLRDALIRVAWIAQIAGCAGVYLLAEEAAVPFYESLGFIALREARPLPMFLPIETVMESLPQGGVMTPP